MVGNCWETVGVYPTYVLQAGAFSPLRFLLPPSQGRKRATTTSTDSVNSDVGKRRGQVSSDSIASTESRVAKRKTKQPMRMASRSSTPQGDSSAAVTAALKNFEKKIDDKVSSEPTKFNWGCGFGVESCPSTLTLCTGTRLFRYLSRIKVVGVYRPPSAGNQLLD